MNLSSRPSPPPARHTPGRVRLALAARSSVEPRSAMGTDIALVSRGTNLDGKHHDRRRPAAAALITIESDPPYFCIASDADGGGGDDGAVLGFGVAARRWIVLLSVRRESNNRRRRRRRWQRRSSKCDGGEAGEEDSSRYGRGRGRQVCKKGKETFRVTNVELNSGPMPCHCQPTACAETFTLIGDC